MDMKQDAVVCLDSTNKEIEVTCPSESEIYQKIKAEFDSGKSLIVTVIRAPVETSKDKFKDEEMVESFKEDKGGDNK